MKSFIFLVLIGILSIASSCLKHGNLYKGPSPQEQKTPLYIYPFAEEIQGVETEILLKTKENTDLSQVIATIPPLKYNKSWLFILSQDDCKHAAYCYTWAAIHGRPLTHQYYYDVRHYLNNDLPPDVYYLGKTLGSTDGAGNEVRFAFTTTLAAEWEYMNTRTDLAAGNQSNYYRFYMKSGLTWENVTDMVNYGTGIAFHDVNTQDVENPDSIRIHYGRAQDSILAHLSGRGCKTLAEPNGNKTYVTAAFGYSPIQVITAQAQTVKLYPFQVESDLQGQLLNRSFSNQEDIKQFIDKQLNQRKEDREAVCIGVHGTDDKWSEFLLWLNDHYGKDGDDSMWFTSLEEYYEYNYYRIHGTIKLSIVDDQTLKLKVSLPAKEYFYYPSVTLNIENLTANDLLSVSTDNMVKGLSFGKYDKGTMINIDCRKYLLEHATHFVKQYEQNPTDITKRDALYFVNQLKPSSQKEALQKRIR